MDGIVTKIQKSVYTGSFSQVLLEVKLPYCFIGRWSTVGAEGLLIPFHGLNPTRCCVLDRRNERSANSKRAR